MNHKDKYGLLNGHCDECSACGQSGCCPPTDCKMTMSSIYCKKYLKELQKTYAGYNKLMKLLYNSQDELPVQLFAQVEEINEETFESFVTLVTAQGII
jgi:hypothetical protein